ncbi:MAG TPA: pyridoxal-dependent decarboxylase [Gemmatimonadaceae bacterium]|nr:pyridoxal-dependent decarboxylase [Gemmatimonadaceae bacterium]
MTDLTLDPRDWEDFRRLAHEMADDVVGHLSTVRDRPVWRPVPAEVRAEFDTPAPLDPTPPAAVYEDFKRHVFPYHLGNTHPRFWGWVCGSGAPVGVLADFLASAMNPNVPGYDQAASLVERQVLRWFAELFGLPPGASGLLVTSGSHANFVALAVARTARAGFDVRRLGVAGGPPLTFYCSRETHQCAQKAVEVLGHGSAALRRLPVDERFRVDVAALEAAVAADRAAGFRPVCVIGNAGTVNTGAVDDLAALGSLCRREALWLHVDGAFGALAALAPELRPLVAGIEHADSVAFDMHKWMYLPYDVAAVLVRDADAHRATFELVPNYLAPTGRGVAPESLPFAQLGLDLSRGFRALKVWMAVKTYGLRAYGAMIAQNVRQAAYLAGRVDAHPELERLAPAPLNVVCFRYAPPGTPEDDLAALNQAILVTLQERGIAVPSSTVVHGRFALRVAITNHRSRQSDFDALVDAVALLGRELSAREAVAVAPR